MSITIYMHFLDGFAQSNMLLFKKTFSLCLGVSFLCVVEI